MRRPPQRPAPFVWQGNVLWGTTPPGPPAAIAVRLPNGKLVATGGASATA